MAVACAAGHTQRRHSIAALEPPRRSSACALDPALGPCPPCDTQPLLGPLWVKWEPQLLPQPTPSLLGAALILRRWGFLLTPLVPPVATQDTSALFCPSVLQDLEGSGACLLHLFLHKVISGSLSAAPLRAFESS